MKSYPLGDELVFSTTFADGTTREPANPTNVTFRLRDPGGAETDVTPTNPSTGVFQATFVPAKSGIWSYRWEGTGAVIAAVEGVFEVQPSAFVAD